MEKTRIVVARRGCITHLDGVNRFIAMLAEGLWKLGHDVEIVSGGFYGVERVEELSQWFAKTQGLDRGIPIHVLETKPRSGGSRIRILANWLFKGNILVRELNADIVIVNGVVPLRLKPKIAVAHGPLQLVSPFQKLILKTLYELYDHVVCVSKTSKREYRGISRCDSIIPLPLKGENYALKPLSEREDIVVHIGTRPVKNPHVSVEVVRLLRERGLDVKLIIIGARNEVIERLC